MKGSQVSGSQALGLTVSGKGVTAGEGGGGGSGGGAGGGHFFSNCNCCLEDFIRFSARRAERRMPLDSDSYKIQSTV